VILSAGRVGKTRCRVLEFTMTTDDGITADDVRRGIHAHMADARSRVDLASISTPVVLLTTMMFDPGFQMVEAHTAATRLLHHKDDDEMLWQNVQLLTTHATTGANFIWARPRRSNDPSPYPQRGRDVQHLLQVTEGELANVRCVRDGIAHLDDKFERWVSDHPGESFSTRTVTEGPPKGGAFLHWDRSTNSLWFLDDRVDIEQLAGELAQIQQRASSAFVLMLSSQDDDLDLA